MWMGRFTCPGLGDATLSGVSCCAGFDSRAGTGFRFMGGKAGMLIGKRHRLDGRRECRVFNILFIGASDAKQ